MTPLSKYKKRIQLIEQQKIEWLQLQADQIHRRLALVKKHNKERSSLLLGSRSEILKWANLIKQQVSEITEFRATSANDVCCLRNKHDEELGDIRIWEGKLLPVQLGWYMPKKTSDSYVTTCRKITAKNHWVKYIYVVDCMKNKALYFSLLPLNQSSVCLRLIRGLLGLLRFSEVLGSKGLGLLTLVAEDSSVFINSQI